MVQCAEGVECIGPFVVGEKPIPLQYQFLDADGQPLNLGGYTARFLLGEEDAVAVDRAATLVAGGATGIVEYLWQATDFAIPGHYVGELWTGNGTQRFASVRVEWDVRRARGPVPVI